MMFKKIIVGCFLLVTFLGLTGCANRTNVDIFPDLTQTDNLITKGESTTQDVREIFGAPTFIGTTKSDGKTICGELSYQRPWNTPEQAVVGGADFLNVRYISKGQDNLYYQKFNVAS